MKAVLVLVVLALAAVAVTASEADLATEVDAVAEDEMGDALETQLEDELDLEDEGEAEDDVEMEADAEAEVEADEEAPNKPARVFARSLMHKKRVITVPKGDPRARAPAAPTVTPTPTPGVPAAAAVPPAAAVVADMKPDTSVPNGEWVSPPVDLVPVLQAAAGSYCTAGATNVRSQATTGSSVVLTTVPGEQLRVTATTEKAANGYTWVPVTSRGKNGWVAKSLLTACPTTQPSTSRTFPLYKQCGQSWSNTPVGTCTTKNMCRVGCAVSSVAMVLKSRGVNTDPGQLNAWLKANGGYASGCSIYWGKVDSFGKTRCQGFQTGNYAAVCGWVKAGRGVILNVNNGGHWVLATGCDGKNNVYVNDPGYSKTSYPFSGVGRMVVYA